MTSPVSKASPLQILHAISSAQFAGVEQFVRRLAIRQAQDGHSVTVLGGPAEDMAGPLAQAGVAWGPAPSTAALFTAVRRPMSASDVVNTHMTAADVAVVLARTVSAVNPAIVSTRHFAQPRGSFGPGITYRVIDRQIDAEVSISRAVAAMVEVPSTVVYPGVEPAAPAVITNRRNLVLVAQRLQPEKETHIAIRSFAASGIARLGWTLEIAGEGPERASLETMAAQLGVARSVRFLGFRRDLPTLMADAGLLVATAPFEHFGLTVLEAMSAGLPVVAADAGGHAEMLGTLDPRSRFAPGSVSSAAAHIRSLVQDPHARELLGEAERDLQRREFTLRAQAGGTEAVYREALTRRAVRR